jgi:hypothetical protein
MGFRLGRVQGGSGPYPFTFSLIHRTESRAKPFWTGKEWAQTVDLPRPSLKIGVEVPKHPS